MQINKQWLDQQLSKLQAESYVLDKVTTFKKHVESLLTYRLSLSEWTLIEFFVLSIGMHIADELLNNHLYQFAINTNDCCLRLLNQNDVKKIIEKYYQCYYEKLNLLTQLSTSKGIVGTYPAIEWLELITSARQEFYIPQEIILYKITNDALYELEVEIKSSGMIELVPQNMAEAIRFHHYELDLLLGKEGIFPVQWTDLNGAAELLNLSPDQLIFECFQNEFGPYLKLGAFKVTRHRALVRLLKESAPFSSSETSLNAFYQGSDIYVSSGSDYTLIRLQPSLAEAVRGINPFIQVNKGQKITRDHLVFIKNELEEFKAKQNDNNKLVFNEKSHMIKESSIDQIEYIAPKVTEAPFIKPKQTRAHTLHILIKDFFKISQGKITNEEMWNKLRLLTEDEHQTVQEVTAWTAHNACIMWKSHTKCEQTFTRKAFQTFMSNLRKEK